MQKYISAILLFIPYLVSSQVCVGDAGKVTWQAWQNLHYPSLGEMYVDEFYPNNPDVTQTVFKLQSPINYDNYMGGRIIGYISVPANDDVEFNLTGDDITRFYLSSDSNPDNMSLTAYADGWSNIEEHDKYPEQTSNVVSLNSGTYYYFELHYAEGGGGDHISLYWKTIHEDPDNWTLINANYINQASCLPSACLERNTPCDDGNPNTTDDKEDGHCNCMGTPTTSDVCLGDQYEITAYAYDTIPGNNINDLYTSPKFPGTPNRSFELNEFALGYQLEHDSTGTLIQAYITVPVTGDYRFNITGNNHCEFFMSSDHDPVNKSAVPLAIYGTTGTTEHDRYTTQSSDFINLLAGNYYYIEMNHKEGSFSEHFSLFWQTPFTPVGEYKRISDFYIYDYACEIACIPEGHPCDDGDPFTNNDMYDDSCDCVGEPCVGAACNDPIASYTPFAKCNTTDQLDNRPDNNWLSCSTEASPNALRIDGHWIQYDLGQEYFIHESHIWNYNVANETDKGMEMVAIDYSIDGQNWNELNVYNWPLADGSSEYSGFIGPNFQGISARYILISSMDMGSACRGIGKVVFNASFCPNSGATCDDGDPSTLFDIIDENCNCVGELAENPCVIDTLMLGDTLLNTGTYTAKILVTSANLTEPASSVLMLSTKEIKMLEGFEVELGSTLLATIQPCTTMVSGESNPLHKKMEDTEIDILKVLPTSDPDYQIIQFYVMDPGQYQLNILDGNDNLLHYIFDFEFFNKGIYYKIIRTRRLANGDFNVEFKGKKVNETEVLSVDTN